MTEREAIERHIKKKGITRLPPVTEENFWELHLKQDERTGYDPLTGAPIARPQKKKKRGKGWCQECNGRDRDEDNRK